MRATGSNGPYQWLSSTEIELSTLLEYCPEVVENKFVAITSFDSGPLKLNEKEIATGWTSRNGVAYSPRITSVKGLPFDIYDEWYVFPTQFDLGGSPDAPNFDFWTNNGQIEIFVNYGGFGLHPVADQELIDQLWLQLSNLRPESFIACGDLLTFATKDHQLFTKVTKFSNEHLSRWGVFRVEGGELFLPNH